MRPTLPPSGVIRTGFLLVDASNIDDETFAQSLPMLRCTPGTLTNADDLTPRLIDVAALTPGQQDDVTIALLRETSGDKPPVICAWLESPLDVDALAQHIVRFLIGPGSEGSPVFWRYYDPRVFSLAMALFLPAQKEALLGPITEWRFPWSQHWWTVPGPGHEIDPLGGRKPAWPTSNQWASLDHCDLIASVLVRMRDTQKNFSPSEALRYQRLADLALIAGKQHLKLADADELIEYALYSVRYGDAFLRHPKLDTAWNALADGTTNWAGLRDLLDHNDYRQLNQQFQLPQFPTGVA